MSTMQSEDRLIELSPQKLLSAIHRIISSAGNPDGPAEPAPRHHESRHTHTSQSVAPHDFSGKWSSLHQETWDGWLRLTPPPPGPAPNPELFPLPAFTDSTLPFWYVLYRHRHLVITQPLPPRLAFLVALSQAVISRARLIHETAAAVVRSTGPSAIIVIGGYASEVADDLCPPSQKLVIHWPFPWPRPWWLDELLDGGDLLVLGSQFAAAAQQTSDVALQKDFLNAADKFAQAGISALQ